MNLRENICMLLFQTGCLHHGFNQLSSEVDIMIMASDRMRKKIKDYAEIVGHIMRKHALIMRKLHRIMRKFKQVIKLIIRPVQCIYMLTVNP